MEKLLQNKEVALIIAFRDFRDVEYFVVRDALLRAGAEISVASRERGIAVGVDGGEADVDLILNDLNVADYDIVVFIGGSGAAKYIDDQLCWQIALDTVKRNKVLGAICCAPAILAKAGVLKGKQATVWSSQMDKSLVKILKEAGAIYQDKEVVIDEKIITGNGPTASEKFAETLTKILK